MPRFPVPRFLFPRNPGTPQPAPIPPAVPVPPVVPIPAAAPIPPNTPVTPVVPVSPDFIRIGNIRYTRREALQRAAWFGGGIATGVLATLATEYLINTHQSAQEVVSPTEMVRGTLLGSYDEQGRLITNTLVPGSHLILVVREFPAPNFSVQSVQEIGAFQDYQDPWQVLGQVDQPNLGSNYLMIANLDAIQGGIPRNTPFQISFNVNYGTPDGQTGTKLNDPGPLQFTRV